MSSQAAIDIAQVEQAGGEAGAHAREDALSASGAAVDGAGVLVERDNRFSAAFEASSLDELQAQLKAFVRRNFPGHTRELSKVRPSATETAANLISTVLATVGKGGFAEWARRIRETGAAARLRA